MGKELKLNERTARLAHGPLTYLEAGQGQPLLFLHGVNGGAMSWQPQLKALSDRFRVVAWNAPGYGGSVPVEGDITALAQAGLELIDTLGCERLPIVGHSLGGVIAMRMLTLRPARFTHAMLSCTHPGYGQPPSGTVMERYARRLAELNALPRMEYGRRRALRMLPRDTKPVPDVVEALAKIAAEVNPTGLETAIRALATADLTPLLPQIRVPTLVLTCEQDPVVSLDKARPLLEGIPGVHHVRLPALGHAAYYERPELFNALLCLLLARRPPDPS